MCNSYCCGLSPALPFNRRGLHNAQIFADASEKTEHIGQFVGLVLAESFEALVLTLYPLVN